MADSHRIPNTYNFKDLAGKTFNGVFVESFAECRKKDGSIWNCRCACGRLFQAVGSAITRNRIARCSECKSPSVKPDFKECRSCKKLLPFTSAFFPENCQHPFGLRATCRACRADVVREPAREYNREVKIEVLTHYGNRRAACVCCGESGIAFLAIDHIHGGGMAHRHTKGRTTNPYHRLRADGLPDGFRTLCHNCNFSLGKYSYCPHDPVNMRQDVERGISRVFKEFVVTETAEAQTCFKCGRTLPLNENFFYRHRMMTSGFLGKCKECTKADMKITGKKLRDATRIEVLTHYSRSIIPHCACCGIDFLEFLSIDHVHGDGAQHRKVTKHANLYRILKRDGFPEGFQVLCHNCNFAKGKNQNVCPHQQRD